jgi:cyclic lactone autoinducer peptide
MNNTKEKLINKIGQKVAVKLGEASISLGEKSFGICPLGFLYEPKIAKELLKSILEK